MDVERLHVGAACRSGAITLSFFGLRSQVMGYICSHEHFLVFFFFVHPLPPAPTSISFSLFPFSVVLVFGDVMSLVFFFFNFRSEMVIILFPSIYFM